MSIRNELRERVSKGFLPSSGEPREQTCQIHLEKKKKHECPIIPVQLCMEAVTQLENSFRFQIFIFYSLASLIRFSVNGKDKLCKYVKVFFIWGALSQSLMSLLHQTAPSRIKRVDRISCTTEMLAS